MPATGTGTSTLGGTATDATGDTLTRAQIEAFTTTHLETAATHWTETAQAWEGHFESIHNGMLRPGGTVWEGDAADKASDRSWGDLVKVRGAADGLHSASGFARNGAEDIAWAKRQVLTAIEEAEEAGFTVEQNLSVRDPTTTMLMRGWETRQQQAQAFATEIGSRAKALVAMDKAVAGKITTALAPMRALRFEEKPAQDHGPTVTAVDYHHFKQDKPKPDPPPVPKERHATDPNRSADGTYGPGNFGDGKAAEKAALDEVERRTRVPVIRQQVRATQPDVINPKTGKLQERYYDGLQPTGNPDEYIGYEAKTNPGSLDRDQQNFDKSVTRDHPARATLNGRPITIVDARTVYPPEGWVPPSAAAGPEHAAGPPALPATVGYPGMPEPPKMWRDDGAPSVHPDDRPGMQGGGSNPFPNWGTHISPDELAKSDDPELRNFGKFYQGMYGRDPNDPDNHA
ncbi:putative conserved membrane protein [Mycobacteroides abscessus subsp. abscessus]|uniref:hypothetical protein n=1 Tax=Mycobacteroides abscessus TaxID=36809 RepID=UPI0009A82340|nr:hypothetical protein [Mycobacteroides abscessus]SLJ23242.1 putative conserved membrane protein [Mycobacteroides abscessus subsp. abscessus]